MPPPPGQDGSIAEQVYMLSLIYGVYLVLFIAVIRISVKDWRKESSFSLTLFVSHIVMFILITIYTFINLYRAVRAYALRNLAVTPIEYYHNYTAWDNYSFIVIVTLLVLHADALVIFRCFLIWGRNYWTIVLPVLLLIWSVVVNITALVGFKNPGAVPDGVMWIFLQMIFPLNIAQSILTTGLITYRIWTQHAQTESAGLSRFSASVSLLTIVRIIIESALIFTVQQILITILQQLEHPAQVILHATMIPSTGIVFVLMTLRTHLAKTETEAMWNSRSMRSDTVRSSGNRPPTSHVAVFTTTTIVEDHPMEAIDSKSGRNSGFCSVMEEQKSRERY